MEISKVIKGLLIAVCGVCMVSCLDEVSNEYRVTVSAFGTVTYDEDGAVRIYMDEGRGIIEPNAKSAPINWGNTVRARIQYDLPFVSSDEKVTSMETYRFRGVVREALRVDTVQLLDMTGRSSQVASLPTDTLYNFHASAYWGFLTMHAVPNNNKGFRMTCSYDRNEFDGETLNLKLHYTEGEGSWNRGFTQTASAELPAFLREEGVVKSDTLQIVVTAPVWYSTARDSAYVDTVKFQISRQRLTPPQYNTIGGGYFN